MTRPDAGQGWQSAAESTTTRLLGRWVGAGRVMGMESRLHMTWERVLDGRFVRLLWRNDMQSKDGPEVFEGHAYYQALADGSHRGQWFDSGGEAHPIRASEDAGALVAEWGTKETRMGRTVYRLLGDNEGEVRDSIHG